MFWFCLASDTHTQLSSISHRLLIGLPAQPDLVGLTDESDIMRYRPGVFSQYEASPTPHGQSRIKHFQASTPLKSPCGLGDTHSDIAAKDLDIDPGPSLAFSHTRHIINLIPLSMAFFVPNGETVQVGPSRHVRYLPLRFPEIDNKKPGFGPLFHTRFRKGCFKACNQRFELLVRRKATMASDHVEGMRQPTSPTETEGRTTATACSKEHVPAGSSFKIEQLVDKGCTRLTRGHVFVLIWLAVFPAVH